MVLLSGLLALERSAALDALGDGAVLVEVGDPVLVVALARAGGGSGVGVDGDGDGDGGGLGLLAALGLGKEGLEPGLVDEVGGAAEDASQEEVEEDAAIGGQLSRRERECATYI